METRQLHPVVTRPMATIPPRNALFPARQLHPPKLSTSNNDNSNNIHLSDRTAVLAPPPNNHSLRLLLD